MSHYLVIIYMGVLQALASWPMDFELLFKGDTALKLRQWILGEEG